ncbi:hypothetical protein F383_10518 [Gossypium arboreum]|uniref:Uncharacterized protein n=1 Tax=Gossypium arboreum TaxID=29729 RepID=A0A0B0PPS4_GOSAR|nr:hypothetical protein F383_10518 [Gossypium arboreum]
MHQISCLPLFDSLCSYDISNLIRFSMNKLQDTRPKT